MVSKSRKTSIARLGPTAEIQPLLLDDIRALLRHARNRAYAAANSLMVDAYWQIGRRIVEEEQGGEARAGCGNRLIPNLARALGDEFGKGVSVANLWNFKQFYLTFPDGGKSYAMRRELTWSHCCLVMCVENIAADQWLEVVEALDASPIIYELDIVRTDRAQNPRLVEKLAREGVQIPPAIHFR